MTLNHKNNKKKWIFQSKLDEKEVLYLFLPLFVEKSYFILITMILDFAITSLPPPPPP